MNAAELSRSVILNQFREFHARVVRLTGDVRRPEAAVNGEQAQSELRAFVDELSRRHAQGSEEIGHGLLEEVQYVMVALADDLFLHLEDWDGRGEWLASTLEEDLYKTREAGGVFFVRIDELLKTRDRSRDEVAAAYLIALMLGFQGRFRNEERPGTPNEVLSYRDRLAGYLGVGRSTSADAGPLFAQAYDHTERAEATAKLPDRRRYVRMLLGAALAYFVVAHVVWWIETADVRSATAAVLAASGQEP